MSCRSALSLFWTVLAVAAAGLIGAAPLAAQTGSVAGTVTDSMSAPMGFGHVYAPSHYIDAWLEVTGIDDWCEAIFAANVVFEPLVGELFRSQLVQQAAPGNGDFITPTIVGAGEYDFAQRDLRYTIAMFELLTNDREFADHNKAIMDGWLTVWVPRAISASRTLQPLWSQPDFKPPRFEDGLDRAKSRFSGILTQLSLAEPKELTQ